MKGYKRNNVKAVKDIHDVRVVVTNNTRIEFSTNTLGRKSCIYLYLFMSVLITVRKEYMHL